MTELHLPHPEEVEQGFKRLATALSYEALLDAGWTSDELTRLREAVEGVSLIPTPTGANIVFAWTDEPDEEVQALLERASDDGPMLLMALASRAAPEVV